MMGYLWSRLTSRAQNETIQIQHAAMITQFNKNVEIWHEKLQKTPQRLYLCNVSEDWNEKQILKEVDIKGVVVDTDLPSINDGLRVKWIFDEGSRQAIGYDELLRREGIKGRPELLEFFDNTN